MRFNWLMLFIFVVGCARPNYQKNSADHNKNHKPVCALYFTKLSACADFAWRVLPTEKDFGSLTLRFWDAADRSQKPIAIIPSEEVSVVLWMPAMGHGSAPVSVVQSDDGSYTVSRVFFTMHGDWQLLFQLKNKNKVIDEAIAFYHF